MDFRAVQQRGERSRSVVTGRTARLVDAELLLRKAAALVLAALRVIVLD